LVYYSPPSVLVEKIDLRTISAERPVVRVKGTYTIPAGETEKDGDIRVNAVLKRMTVKVPSLSGGETVSVSILDEIGATVYQETGLTEGTHFSANNIDIPLAGRITIKVQLSGTQSSDKTIYVFLYGI